MPAHSHGVPPSPAHPSEPPTANVALISTHRRPPRLVPATTSAGIAPKKSVNRCPRGDRQAAGSAKFAPYRRPFSDQRSQFSEIARAAIMPGSSGKAPSATEENIQKVRRPGLSANSAARSAGRASTGQRAGAANRHSRSASFVRRSFHSRNFAEPMILTSVASVQLDRAPPARIRPRKARPGKNVSLRHRCRPQDRPAVGSKISGGTRTVPSGRKSAPRTWLLRLRGMRSRSARCVPNPSRPSRHHRQDRCAG